MGFAISWLAVKDKSREEILELLDFSETETKEKIPESDICSVLLQNGWYIIWFNRCESPYVRHDVISDLSKGCSLVTCVVEEHVMYSRSEYWQDGGRVWAISHDAQQGMYDLQTSGIPPEGFEVLKSKVFAEQDEKGGDQAGVDHIFDLPLIPAKNITFFKHDEETPELQGLEFTVLASNKRDSIYSKSKPWWKLW